MKPEALNIIKMISKPINERMPFEGIELTKFVQKIPFFHRFFPSQAEKFVSFCLSAQLMEFEPGDSIFGHEKSPEFIYIIIDGSVRLTPRAGGQARTAGSYYVLGNVEVVFDLKERGQVAVAESPTSCMVLEAHSFRGNWQKHEEINKTFHYLMINKYFEDLSVYEKQSLALLMIHSKFKAGETIIQEQQASEKVYFIIYGKLQVTKKLIIKGHQKEAIIDSIEELDSYGEYEAVSGQPAPVSLRTTSSGTFYCLSIEEVKREGHPILEYLKQHSIPYPSREELQFRYSVQADVERYQKKVKKSLRMPQCS